MGGDRRGEKGGVKGKGKGEEGGGREREEGRGRTACDDVRLYLLWLRDHLDCLLLSGNCV